MNDIVTHDLPQTMVIDDDPRYEEVDGCRVEKPPMGAYEETLAGLLMETIAPFARANNLGRVVQDVLFDLAPIRRKRRPDIAFVSSERWPRRKRVPRLDAWRVIPDLAVEVVSQSNGAEEINTKKHEYFRSGVRMVWVIWPDSEEVYVYTSPTDVRILTRNDTITGGDVIPGFSMPLAELFGEPEEETGETAPA